MTNTMSAFGTKRTSLKHWVISLSEYTRELIPSPV